ncbi:MAG: amidohydrolase [Candidatus Thermoplasmatota archaeon]|nr:amidohydrolase [Candidatus Thermoplasmatota archaeon]
MKLDELIKLRRLLHRYAELSGNEKHTSEIITAQLVKNDPTDIITNLAGGYGVAAVFDSGTSGPTLMIRAELDALPIEERLPKPYKSITQNVSHVCGHDGHMAILIGVSEKLTTNRDRYNGKVIVLFQPAEETAAGAKQLMNDTRFQAFRPDLIIGFHNIPGFSLGEVLIKNKVFSVASKGLIIRLHGETTHAGTPEKGKNPTNALIEVLQIIQHISEEYQQKDTRSFITVIHVNLGEVAFGTSPGDAVVMATLRSPEDSRMEQMSSEILTKTQGIVSTYELKWEHEWVEVFPAVKNDEQGNQEIIKASTEIGVPITYLSEPFRWSEDFSYYQEQYRSVFFGIGSGIHQPSLHTEIYDFPDELIPLATDLCFQILCNCSKRWRRT